MWTCGWRDATKLKQNQETIKKNLVWNLATNKSEPNKIQIHQMCSVKAKSFLEFINQITEKKVQRFFTDQQPGPKNCLFVFFAKSWRSESCESGEANLRAFWFYTSSGSSVPAVLSSQTFSRTSAHLFIFSFKAGNFQWSDTSVRFTLQGSWKTWKHFGLWKCNF